MWVLDLSITSVSEDNRACVAIRNKFCVLYKNNLFDYKWMLRWASALKATIAVKSLKRRHFFLEILSLYGIRFKPRRWKKRGPTLLEKDVSNMFVFCLNFRKSGWNKKRVFCYFCFRLQFDFQLIVCCHRNLICV